MLTKNIKSKKSIFEKKIYVSQKDLIYTIFFALLFIIVSKDGIIKYSLLAIGSLLLIILGAKIKLKYFRIINHVLIYVAIGLLLSLINHNLNFNTLKQTLIYLISGISAICIFAYHGSQNTNKLINYQFYGLIIAYLLLYSRYFTLEKLYFESNIYAYIFGIYGIIYFYKKNYIKMTIAIIFMLLDHKRITTAAFIVAMLCFLIVKLCRTKKTKNFINNFGCLLLFVAPILWIMFCKNGMLASIFAKLGINSMGRLEGTSAWNIASEYYEFSIFYLGKGIGWVLEWLENANVFSFNNLHNDFLVAYMELGFVGFLIWELSFIALIKYTKKTSVDLSNFILILIGFMFINFLTDNIYLYVTFLLPFYIIILSFLFKNKSELTLKKSFR